MKFRFNLHLSAGICLFTLLTYTGMAAAQAQRDPNLDQVSSSPLPGQEDVQSASGEKHFGNLIYTPPAGWKQDGSSIRVYLAPDLQPGENCRILLLPSSKSEGDFAGSFERVMAQVRSGLKAKLIGPGQLSQRKGPQGSDNMNRTDVIELPGGARWTCYLGLLRAGNREETIVSFASSAALYTKYLPVLNRFVGQVRFANLEQEAVRKQAAAATILVEGDPVLTQEMAERFYLFFEWLLEAPMTQEQRKAITDALVTLWKSGKRSDMNGVIQFVQTQQQIEQKSLAEREVIRGKLQPILLDSLRKQNGDETSRWILSLYANAHKTIATGAVPLTRQASDAYIEMLDFMHNQAVGGEPFVATQKDKDEFARQIAASYGNFSPELQKHIAGATLLWASLRVAWNGMNDADRAEQKTKFVSYLKNMAPDYLQKRALQGGVPGTTGDPAADAALFQRQHNNYVFLSNMSMMRHAAMMNAINNIGGYHPYTYVVR